MKYLLFTTGNWIFLYRKPLPKVIEGQHIQNELDKQGQYYRVNELETIVREASNLRENATDINDALSEVENYLGVLDNLCIEVCIHAMCGIITGYLL